MDRKKIINTYIIIITIITVLAMIVGVYRVTRIGIPKISLGKLGNASESTKLEAFDKINLDTGVCNIELRTGNDYMIDYETSGVLGNDYVPQVEINDGTLFVTQKKTKESTLFKSLSSCNIIITVPEDAKLEIVEMKPNVCDVEIDDIHCKELTVDSHVGDIEIKNTTGDLMKVTADVGDIDISKCKYDNISVISNVGDVKIKDSICNVVSANSNIGDVTVENVLDVAGNKPQMEINLDIGNKKIDD